ncbi:MAG: TetR family transcriptional regulator [Acidobacteriota bacterium]
MSVPPPSTPSPAPRVEAIPAAGPVTRRRLSSKDRRSQLLAHAIELFARRGFSGTRTKDIAAACGVSEGILFRHFATKEDLYHAILETHADEAGSKEWMLEMKRWAAERNDRELVHCLVTQVIKSFREDAAFHRLMMYAWLEGHSLADMVHQRMGLPTFDFLQTYVTGRQSEGAFRAGEPGAMVIALYSPALQYAMSKYVFGMEVFHLADADVAGEFTELLLAGLLVPAAQVKKAVRKKKKVRSL